MQIELKVDSHPSGRLTLKHRDYRSESFSDYPAGSPLFGNENPAKFYRAVAREIADLTKQGHQVQYEDVL